MDKHWRLLQAESQRPVRFPPGAQDKEVAMPTSPSPGKAAEDLDERLIDEALDESFPASDPASPAVGHGQPRDRTAPEQFPHPASGERG